MAGSTLNFGIRVNNLTWDLASRVDGPSNMRALLYNMENNQGCGKKEEKRLPLIPKQDSNG